MPNQGWRILLVDDNPIAQTITSTILRKHAYEVDCASSGAEAVRCVAASHYDLILMDLQMPGMDGFQTMSALRGSGECQGVPILALTANTEEDYREACAKHGMDGFLEKPIRPRELISAIERHIRPKPKPIRITPNSSFETSRIA